MLAVVEDEQQLPLARVFDQRVRHPTAWLLLQPKSGGDCLGDERGVREWIELDQPDPVSGLTDQL